MKQTLQLLLIIIILFIQNKQLTFFNGNYKSGLNNTILDAEESSSGREFIKVHIEYTVLTKRLINE